MIPMIPKELVGKIRFKNSDVFIKEGVILTEEEQDLFTRFRKSVVEGWKDRFN